MNTLLAAPGDVIAFIERGGPVLWLILVVLLMLWAIIVERYLYLRLGFPRLQAAYLAAWSRFRDHGSWAAHRIREAMVARARQSLRRGLPTLRTLIALCPLLGLLGTVTGMIEVFDVVSIRGTGDARALASGISRATLPTMAGMVAALSGLYFQHSLERQARIEAQRLQDRLQPASRKRGAKA